MVWTKSGTLKFLKTLVPVLGSLRVSKAGQYLHVPNSRRSKFSEAGQD